MSRTLTLLQKRSSEFEAIKKFSLRLRYVNIYLTNYAEDKDVIFTSSSVSLCGFAMKSKDIFRALDNTQN